jgi:dienelactone hydrolase
VAESVRRALVIAGFAMGAAAAMPVRAAEPPRAAAVTHPPGTPAPKASSAADLELLEFLGSDDVEPDFQDYLANREPTKASASGRSDKK